MNHFCKKASQLQSDGFERTLTVSERLRLHLHLLICGACRNYDTNIELLHQFFHTIRNRNESDETIALPESSRARIQDALKDRNNQES